MYMTLVRFSLLFRVIVIVMATNYHYIYFVLRQEYENNIVTVDMLNKKKLL